MPTPREENTKLRFCVGVKTDLSDAPIEKVKKAFKTNEGLYADKLWNSCYLFSEMYHRDNWKFEFPPNNTGFYSWVCREFPDQVHSKSDVMARIDIYNLYSNFDNLEVVKQVKKMAVTKAYGIRQFVEAHPEKVLAILKTALKLNGEELYAALRSEFPLDEDNLPRDTGSRSGGKGPVQAILNFLATKNIGVLEDEIFIPRRSGTTLEQEYAWLAVAHAYMADGENRSLDSFFAAAVEALVETQPHLIDMAKTRWSVYMESKRGDQAAWPFDLLREAEGVFAEAAE